MNLRPATAADATDLARVHAAAFDAAWGRAELADLLGAPGAFGLAVDADGAVAGFILCRVAADEAEILTLAVIPADRRQGIGEALVAAAAGLAQTAGAVSLFLEVADDNVPARALYESAGFEVAGRRVGYYTRAAGARADALVMRRILNTAPRP